MITERLASPENQKKTLSQSIPSFSSLKKIKLTEEANFLQGQNIQTQMTLLDTDSVKVQIDFLPRFNLNFNTGTLRAFEKKTNNS